MIRLVRTNDGVIVDSTGKQPGRGAYLHVQQDCISKGINGAIARALKSEITEANLNQLKEFLSDHLSTMQDDETENLSTKED